jgi:SAM-dependent methyltransferase
VTIKDLVRPLPGVRRASLFRQRLAFSGSMKYWERNYVRGGTSGDGSYGLLGQFKADFLNSFVRDRAVNSVTEFGCGDGNQLALAEYPRYVGLDVSRTAVTMCKLRFANDGTKSFFLYDGNCFADKAGLFVADLTLSLDVIYHLTEDDIFERYMQHLFDASLKYVIIYSTNTLLGDTAPHVRHREFTSWVNAERRQWRLAETRQGVASGPGRADFFIYEQLPDG